MNTQQTTLTAALLVTALVMGLYYGYSISVNPGLAQLDDTTYLSAMQSINTAIQNPLFFVAFFGALILLPLSAYLHYEVSASRFYLLVAAAALYTVASFGVTVLGNVPLNEALASVDISSATLEQLSQARLHFEPKWNFLHTIRTIATAVSFLLTATAAVVK